MSLYLPNIIAEDIEQTQARIDMHIVRLIQDRLCTLSILCGANVHDVIKNDKWRTALYAAINEICTLKAALATHRKNGDLHETL